MKRVTVKMVTRLAGPEGVRQPGDLFSVPENVADELIAGGYAELALRQGSGQVPVVEEATAEPPEKAVSRPRAKRKRPATQSKSKRTPKSKGGS